MRGDTSTLYPSLLIPFSTRLFLSSVGYQSKSLDLLSLVILYSLGSMRFVVGDLRSRPLLFFHLGIILRSPFHRMVSANNHAKQKNFWLIPSFSDLKGKTCFENDSSLVMRLLTLQETARTESSLLMWSRRVLPASLHLPPCS